MFSCNGISIRICICDIDGPLSPPLPFIKPRLPAKELSLPGCRVGCECWIVGLCLPRLVAMVIRPGLQLRNEKVQG